MSPAVRRAALARRGGLLLFFALALAAVAPLAAQGAHGARAAAPAAPSKGGLAHPEFLVSAARLHRELGSPGLLIIDARSHGEYLSGHIPGAVNLPLAELQHTVRLANGNPSRAIVDPPSMIEGPLRRAGIDGSSRIVIYDGGQTFLATREWWMLDYYGHRNIAILDGGLPAWKERGGALSTKQVKPPEGSFRPVANPQKIATYRYVVAHLGTSATSVCDALSASSYAAGAIPGSINLPWTKTIDTKAFGKFKQAAALAALLETVAPSKSHPIIFYCERGYVSSVEYFVARALGYTHVRLYDGSLSDFTAHGGKLKPSGGR